MFLRLATALGYVYWVSFFSSLNNTELWNSSAAYWPVAYEDLRGSHRFQLRRNTFQRVPQMSPILTYRFGPEVYLLIIKFFLSQLNRYIKSRVIKALILQRTVPITALNTAADSTYNHTTHCSGQYLKPHYTLQRTVPTTTLHTAADST